jgi:inorganic pyrophosphatase
MADEKGPDIKVIAVPTRNPRFDEIRDLKSIPAHTLREFEHFFRVYKDLEPKSSATFGWRPRKAALRAIVASHHAYERGSR